MNKLHFQQDVTKPRAREEVCLSDSSEGLTDQAPPTIYTEALTTRVTRSMSLEKPQEISKAIQGDETPAEESKVRKDDEPHAVVADSIVEVNLTNVRENFLEGMKEATKSSEMFDVYMGIPHPDNMAYNVRIFLRCPGCNQKIHLVSKGESGEKRSARCAACGKTLNPSSREGFMTNLDLEKCKAKVVLPTRGTKARKKAPVTEEITTGSPQLLELVERQAKEIEDLKVQVKKLEQAQRNSSEDTLLLMRQEQKALRK